MRPDDKGKSLAALRGLAQELGLIFETASSTYSRQFMWSRLASRLHAVGAHDGAPKEWWSTLRDVSAMEMASETLLATSTWVPDFFKLHLYAWFVQSHVENGGPPTLSGAAWVEVDRSQLSKDLKLQTEHRKHRVLGSPLAKLHALAAALGDRRAASEAIDNVVPNMMKDVYSSLCGAALIGQLRFGARLCEFCPLTGVLLFMETAAVSPSLDEVPTGVGLPYTLPRTLQAMQDFIDRCGDVGGGVVALPYATHIDSHPQVQRYLHRLAGLRQEEMEELEREIRDVAERVRQRDTWRLEAAAAGVFLSHSTFKIYRHRHDVYLSTW